MNGNIIFNLIQKDPILGLFCIRDFMLMLYRENELKIDEYMNNQFLGIFIS